MKFSFSIGKNFQVTKSQQFLPEHVSIKMSFFSVYHLLCSNAVENKGLFVFYHLMGIFIFRLMDLKEVMINKIFAQIRLRKGKNK